ncbi:Bug family tripartite tricarboxylate transporter substrate binding protein [Acidovorax sp.]|uniref:Bug family tripartite tricarboxylate transporter substrate binding protein n=1 Tax=Acidovorax sp. TaxID=1872122 RepID=UPI004038218B
MTFNRFRRLALASTAAMCSFPLLVTKANAQNGWPARPVSLVVPFPEGGTSDQLGRLVAEELTKSLGQTVKVRNLPGAGGATGCTAVAREPADGHTLLLSGIGSNAIAHALTPTPGYNSNTDFVHVSQLVAGPNVLVVHPDSPLKSLGELIEIARKLPGKLTYGQVNASSGHLAMELLRQTLTTCVKGAAGQSCTSPSLTAVPFAGGAAALSGVLNGSVSILFTNLDAALQHLRNGKLRALAVTSLFGNPQLPGVPSVSESGYPGFAAVSWVGVSARAGTPAPIVSRLEATLRTAFSASPARAQLEAAGFVVVASNSSDYGALVQRETERWARVIKIAGVKAG